MSVDLYLTDRLARRHRGPGAGARAAARDGRRRRGRHRAHRALRLLLVRGRPGARRAARPRPRSRSSPATDDARALGFALARHTFLAAWRGDTAEARRSGDRAARIADELGDDVGCAAPRRSGSRSRGCSTATWAARADLLAAADVGLRHRLDDLATTPMSNLCHYDVEQGRFAEAEESVADALRISEERDTPSCTAWQLGVRARLRLLQGRWAEAEDDARAVLASGDLPLGRLWPHLVLGMLAARRDGAAGEPAPGRAVAAGEPARQPRHGRGGRGRARRERVDHPAPGSPARRSAGDRAVRPGVRRPGGRAAPRCGAGRGAWPRPASSRSARPRRTADAGPGGPALRAGDGAVGRRVDRRPAGRARRCSTTSTPGRSPPCSAPGCATRA